jgi:hypothetical protein
LDILDKKYLDYFVFSTFGLAQAYAGLSWARPGRKAKILLGSDLDRLLSLSELVDLKGRKDPKIPSRKQLVKLKDLAGNLEYEFYSLSKAAAFIAEISGSCDRHTLNASMKKGTIYKKRWILEKL